MSSLPQEKSSKFSDKGVTKFFNNYFSKELSFPTNQVDAVVSFFEKRGFDKTASISVATTLLQQSKIDEVNIFKLLDTLTGLTEVQLSSIVTEVLNYNRPKTSTLGYKRTETSDKVEKRNIVA
jgi:hypothetical protein